MTINDSNWKFLHDATGLSLTFNDMYARYLRGLGFVGVLQDMIRKSGLGMNPSGIANPSAGGGASSYAPRPAPSGYRWDFVTSQGVRVTSQNEPVVALVRAA